MREISIIIPTYNRAITLKKVINSYIIQKYVKELIIIDDGSKVEYKCLNKYINGLCEEKQIDYKYLRNKKNMGAAYCRNIGVKNSNYDYIFWGEDDVFLKEDYIERLVEEISENEIYCGAIIYDISLKKSLESQKSVIDKQRKSKKPIFDYKKMEGYFRVEGIKKQEIPFGHALILVPKSAYKGVKYYEGYDYNGYREESDAQVQMVQNGYKIYYNGNAVCYHMLRNEIEEKSGQHKGNWLKYEFFKLKNNFIFFNRYKSFFKIKYKNKSKIIASNYLFTLDVLKIILKKSVKSILMR
ncbi:GT2 family glycosyltransferase [Hypnocyclicus thermotrophus]|uniref:GT2 family glycosyltransferase n=1 Tax=Hypnocyclicus thermotrophus TaxID=1627895 RepID=A0AA46I5B0_9FUSO|nr:glycosyltransferase [Hypnocyclicus thermotrophus]TDT67875.1 GT2 family glycosyltransferase [Hypnocyclicus thermotrophus]